MTIGIDIDDTLTQALETKIATAKAYIKQENLPYKQAKDKKLHLFSELFNWTTKDWEKFWFKHADIMLAKLPTKPNASKITHALKNMGHTIIIVTARSPQWHTDPYQLSFDWLTKNNIAFDKIFVNQKDKVHVCLENNVDVFIDDLPETLLKLKEVGIVPILMKNPHNEDMANNPNYYTITNWKEVPVLLNTIKKPQ